MTSSPGAASDSIIEASYTFHAELERPAVFLRREWRAIALCAGMFSVVLLTIILGVEPPFFHPRIESDQLLYLLKAQSLVETGSTAARIAVNLDPFPYAAMPGILRAPFLLIFSDFDYQLRGIQIMNLAIVVLTGIMAAYMFSWVIPQSAHRWAIAFTFGFMLLSHAWLTNIIVPLADAPYAALTLACIIIAAMALTSKRPLRTRPGLIAFYILLFTIAFFIRYTAPALLLLPAILAWKRWNVRRIPLRVPVLVLIASMLLLTGLIALDADAILGRYLGEVKFMVVETNKANAALHLFSSSLPAQVIPVFNLGFQVNPLISKVVPVLGTTPRDIVWCIVGLGISALVIRGMILTRRKLFPELAVFLAALPLLALLTPSTTRYLMSYQPLIWMCFFTGLADITKASRARASQFQLRLLAGAAGMIILGGVLFLRAERTVRTAGGNRPLKASTGAFAYVHDVANTFRHLRTFIETLPPERTLLVGTGGNYGRYKIISGRDYYQPDVGLLGAAREKSVYAVLTCSTAATCRDFDHLLATQTRRIERHSPFSYGKVFEYRTDNARALVRRLIPPPPRPLSDDIWIPYSASGRTAR